MKHSGLLHCTYIDAVPCSRYSTVVSYIQYGGIDTVQWYLDGEQWSHAAIDKLQWSHTAIETVQWPHAAIGTEKGSHFCSRQKLHICTACIKLHGSCPELHEIGINLACLYRGGLCVPI